MPVRRRIFEVKSYLATSLYMYKLGSQTSQERRKFIFWFQVAVLCEKKPFEVKSYLAMIKRAAAGQAC